MDFLNHQNSTKNHISSNFSTRAQIYQPRIDEYLILVPSMVPYFVTQMGNHKNRELSCDRKLTKIGNFSPFRVSEIVFKRKNRILHQKIHKNRCVNIFLTNFPSCFSLGQRSTISNFRGRSFITLQQGGGQRVRGDQIFFENSENRPEGGQNYFASS